MDRRKVFSIFLFLLGIIFFAYGTHLSSLADRGEKKLSQAEENEEGRRRPVIGPLRKSAQMNRKETAEQKIQQEGEKLAQSEVSAYWFKGIGVLFFAAGIGYFFTLFSRRK